MTTFFTASASTPRRPILTCWRMKSIVTPCSLWVRVSPQHISGVMPCSRALRTFLLTVSSVSAKYSRLSEWPMITYLTPRSSSMHGAISPVKAPFSSKYIFSAPILMLVPSAAARAAGRSMAGTQKRTSTSSFAKASLLSLMKAAAWLGVMFIFQLPAARIFLAMGIIPPFYEK